MEDNISLKYCIKRLTSRPKLVIEREKDKNEIETNNHNYTSLSRYKK